MEGQHFVLILKLCLQINCIHGAYNTVRISKSFIEGVSLTFQLNFLFFFFLSFFFCICVCVCGISIIGLRANSRISITGHENSLASTPHGFTSWVHFLRA